MGQIGAFEARTHFSELLRRVDNGEEFLVTVRGRPVASLTAAEPSQMGRSVAVVLDDRRALRQGIVKRGSVLGAGESWKDLARDGVKW